MKKALIRYVSEIHKGFEEKILGSISAAIGVGIFSWIVLLILIGISKSGAKPLDIQALGWGMLASQAIGGWVDSIIRHMENRFTSGDIQAQMLLPGNFFLQLFTDYFAQYTVAFLVKISVIGVIGASIIGIPNLQPHHLLLLPLILLGIAIWVLLFLFISGWLFWSERVSGLKSIIQKIAGITAGQFVPIGLMPGIIQTVAGALPLIYGGYLVGYLFARFDWVLLIKTTTGTLIWATILLCLNLFLYSKGLKRLSVNGG